MSPPESPSRLHELRSERNLTVRQLARAAGCTERTIQRAAKRRPGFPMSAFIAGALKADPEDVWPEPAPQNETLGQRARRLRKARGLSATEFARQLELSRRTVERLEFDGPTKPWVRRSVFEALGDPLPPRVVDYDEAPRSEGLASPELLHAIADAVDIDLPRRHAALRRRPVRALVFALMCSSGYPDEKRAVRSINAVIRAYGHDLNRWAAAPAEELANVIGAAGGVHGHNRKIHAMLVSAQRLGLRTIAIERLSTDSAIALLASLDEVRRPLARRALYQAFGAPLHPPADEQLRVARRLQLVDDHATATDVAALISEAAPAGEAARVHAALVAVASRACHADWPECAGCALLAWCPTGERRAGRRGRRT